MFVISEMSDSIRVPPWLFRVSPNEAIVEQLNRRLANKVVIDVGLCIALYDITKIEDSRILPGDGSFHTTVQFRYVVFRPFLDEVLIGKIRSSSQEGIYVSIGFFEDILVTPDGMQHPARFDEKEQLWVWLYEAEGKVNDLYMDLGEEIRFRVVDEVFVDTTPGGPETTELPDAEERHVPYFLKASISEPGLGLLKWWT
ncbi:DNA-directed RNA polymerase III subunit RPC8 [Rhipicephalus sanguineus]|uniref:DNA-directed RNA polymerase III subunit RPC8 n=1 Tax=Rhipicephalus sanguineus TaxID=34632 RepID=UPI0020C1C985|nr:DNA-directed RNA polymerase III subunit RPC8 [Rhipicephalus sanguineus]